MTQCSSPFEKLTGDPFHLLHMRYTKRNEPTVSRCRRTPTQFRKRYKTYKYMTIDVFWDNFTIFFPT